MKRKAGKRILISFICIMLLVGTVFGMNSIDSKASSLTDNLIRKIERIIAFQEDKFGAKEIQKLLNGYVTQGAMESGVTQTYVIGMYGYCPEYDYSKITAKLAEIVQSPEDIYPSSLQKISMMLNGFGAGETYFYEDTIGEKGIMTEVYGLLMLRSTGKENAQLRDQILERIEGLQLSDGGFAVNGSEGDVDVTAMTLQALALYPQEAGEMIDKGLAFLQQVQKEDAGFAASGTECSESTAQVIIALYSLGIDAQTDERFKKDGKTPLDALQTFELKDGTYMHAAGGEYNDMATSQAFCAWISAIRYYMGQSALYDYPNYSEGAYLDDPESGSLLNFDYRFIVIAAVAIIMICALVILKMMYKFDAKHIAAVLIAGALMCALAWVLKVQGKDDYKSENVLPKDSAKEIHVDLQIRCDTLIGEEAAPSDGIILKETAYTVPEGTTAFVLLDQVVRDEDIQMEYSGTGDYVYVQGIEFLYEQKYGDLSGWMFMVNEKFPDVGAGAFVLSEGDDIVWVYTRDIGNDIRPEDYR